MRKEKLSVLRHETRYQPGFVPLLLDGYFLIGIATKTPPRTSTAEHLYFILAGRCPHQFDLPTFATTANLRTSA